VALEKPTRDLRFFVGFFMDKGVFSAREGTKYKLFAPS
jgi:hypothetical protein